MYSNDNFNLLQNVTFHLENIAVWLIISVVWMHKQLATQYNMHMF